MKSSILTPFMVNQTFHVFMKLEFAVQIHVAHVQQPHSLTYKRPPPLLVVPGR